MARITISLLQAEKVIPLGSSLLKLVLVLVLAIAAVVVVLMVPVNVYLEGTRR